jgi:hypothetical protein
VRRRRLRPRDLSSALALREAGRCAKIALFWPSWAGGVRSGIGIIAWSEGDRAAPGMSHTRCRSWPQAPIMGALLDMGEGQGESCRILRTS